MCKRYAVGAGAGVTAIVASSWAYSDHRLGLMTTLGAVLATEIVVAAVVILLTIHHIMASHSPQNVIEHTHTHPVHKREPTPERR